MHLIKRNKITYIQDEDGVIGELSEHLIDLVNLMIPEIWSPHNTKNESITCKHCKTAHRLTEQRNGHCPFCWRLI